MQSPEHPRPIHPSTNHNVLVGHGLHPGELNMEELYDRLTRLTEEEGVVGLDHTIFSPDDWRLKRRLFDGKENLTELEPDELGSRGQQLLARYCLRARQYDIAIHPHGNSLKGTDIAIYSANTTPFVKQVAGYLGLSRAIIRANGIGAALPNSLGIEIGVDSPLLNFDMTHEKIASLTRPDLVLPPAPDFDEYIYMGDITTRSANMYCLRMSYEPLEPLTPRDAGVFHRALGSDALELVALFWDGAANDHRVGFRGEVFARYPLPSSYPISEHRRIVI